MALASCHASLGMLGTASQYAGYPRRRRDEIKTKRDRVPILGSELINFLASDNTILIRFSKGIGIMRRNLFWLNDEQWARIKPHLPTDVRGVERVDDRRVISGIVHVLKSGCRWRDCPSVYGPRTTIYNRFNRWSRRRIWQRIFQALVEAGWIDATVAIDSTYVKAHRSAHGGKGGRRRRPLDYRVAVRPQKSMS